MEEQEVMNEFTPTDTDSDWSEDESSVVESPVEDTKEVEMSESSDYEEEENCSSEEENSEDLDSAIIDEEFVIDSPVEESVETIEIDLTHNQIGQSFSFSIVQLGKCFLIKATSHTTMDSVIREIESFLGMNRKYLCIRNINVIRMEDYPKTMDSLGIQNGFVLSLSYLFSVHYEDEIVTIETTDCKDMNDFYVLLLHELKLPSLQLIINSKKVPTLQYPSQPFSTYFKNDVHIEVKPDIIINIHYHNMVIPFFFQSPKKYLRVKNGMSCYNLYRMIQDTLNVTYPLLILFGTMQIQPSMIIPEDHYANIKELTVYDLYIRIPSCMSIPDYTITYDTTYGKEATLKGDFTLDDDYDYGEMEAFVLQFSELVDVPNVNRVIISSKECILQSGVLARQFGHFFEVNKSFPANLVNRNYSYNHKESEVVELNDRKETQQPERRSKERRNNNSNHQPGSRDMKSKQRPDSDVENNSRSNYGSQYRDSNQKLPKSRNAMNSYESSGYNRNTNNRNANNSNRERYNNTERSTGNSRRPPQAGNSGREYANGESQGNNRKGRGGRQQKSGRSNGYRKRSDISCFVCLILVFVFQKMEVVLNKVEEKLSELDKQLSQYERLNNMSKKLNIRVSLLITMIVLLGSISCFVFFGPSLLANLIGVLYPVYHTLTILRNHTEMDYVEIITYWIVFGILYVLESAIPSISYFLPFFYPFKVSLLISCLSKDTNFSAIFYDSILAGYFGFPSLLEMKKKTQSSDKE